MRYLYLDKKRLPEFVQCLQQQYRIVGPVKKENQFVFAQIQDPAQMTLEHLPTILPPKKYFLPQQEKLGTFAAGDVRMQESLLSVRPTVIFGAHTCDIEGIECLDVVMNDQPYDPYFRTRRKTILIIGYECMKPCDANATCVTMGTHVPKSGYDLMITDLGDGYVVHVNSKEGGELANTTCAVFEADQDEAKLAERVEKARATKTLRFKKALTGDTAQIAQAFEGAYKDPVWEDVGKRCVSCGNCTVVCPTCYCFDIYDAMKLDLSGGARMRVWDSCQLEEFATVAGGENFREERSSRQRHRYYRKFNYSVKKNNKFFCVGCGRCTRACVAQISLIETVNALTKETSHE